MSAPFYKLGAFGDEASLIVAFLIGIGFGFFLERAGFGSAKKLVSQFYLNDLSVFKVMFTAIVTAMLGVTYLSWAGFLDLSLVYLVPTYWVAQVVGGLLLGVGFVVGGYCPGTSIAATATGKLDGLVFVLGFAAGTLGFALAFPLVKGLYTAGDIGTKTLPQVLGIPYGILVFGVVLMAVFGFMGATWVERKMAARAADGVGEPTCACLSKLTLNQKLGGLALALGALAVFANVAPGHTVTVDAKELLTGVERQEDHVTPAELAAWIIEGRTDYRLVDIRDEKAFAEYHIPTAENVPLATVADGALGRTEKIVLYGDGGIHAAQAWMVLKGRGYTRVYTLLEGLDAWKDEVLFPVMPQSPTPEQQARFERAAQVAKFFGGQPAGRRGAGRRADGAADAGGGPGRGPADAPRRRRRRPEEEARRLLNPRRHTLHLDVQM